MNMNPCKGRKETAITAIVVRNFGQMGKVAAGIVMESITKMDNHPEDWQKVTRRSISAAHPGLF